jgi:hypothetical protein
VKKSRAGDPFNKADMPCGGKSFLKTPESSPACFFIQGDCAARGCASVLPGRVKGWTHRAKLQIAFELFAIKNVEKTIFSLLSIHL